MGLRKAGFANTLKQTSTDVFADAREKVLDTLLPPHSLITGKPLTPQEQELWQNLVFLDDPCCDACGFPFEYGQGDGALCLRCEAKHPAYTRARGAIEYGIDSRKLVLDFKHGGRTDGMAFFTAQMHRVGADLLSAADFMIPVPLHAKRLRKRRFNQAALLARALSKFTGVPYDTEILARAKNTVSQGGQSYLGRKRNVAGAFNVPLKAKPKLKGKHVLLIDDVYTTGATLNACALTLKRSGAAQVDAITLMRVVSPVSVAT